MTVERTQLDRLPAEMINAGLELPMTDQLKIALPDIAKKELDGLASSLVKAVTSSEIELPDELAMEIRSIGNSVIRASADSSNHLLDAPIANMMKNSSKDSPVAKDMAELRSMMADLNPSRKRKVLGLIPFARSAEQIAMKWQSSQTGLRDISQRLEKSSENLALDNQALMVERDNVKKSMTHLAKYIHMVESAKGQLQDELIAASTEGNDEKTRVVQYAIQLITEKELDLKENARIYEIQYLGYGQSLEVSRRFQDAIEKTRTTTLSALRGAILMNQSVASQQRVDMEQKAVNALTGEFMESAAKALRENSAIAAQNATSTSISMEKLRNTYQTLQATLQETEKRQQEAVSTMENVIKELDSGFAVTPYSVVSDNTPSYVKRSIDLTIPE